MALLLGHEILGKIKQLCVNNGIIMRVSSSSPVGELCLKELWRGILGGVGEEISNSPEVVGEVFYCLYCLSAKEWTNITRNRAESPAMEGLFAFGSISILAGLMDVILCRVSTYWSGPRPLGIVECPACLPLQYQDRNPPNWEAANSYVSSHAWDSSAVFPCQAVVCQEISVG